MKRNTSVDCNIYIVHLLKGVLTDLDNAEKKLQEFGLHFPHDGFMLAGFKIDGLQETDRLEENDQKVMQVLKGNLVSEYTGYIVKGEITYLCIYNFPFPVDRGKGEEVKERISDFSNRVMEISQSKHGLALRAVASEIHHGFDSISTAYREILDMFEYEKVTGNDSKMIKYSDYFTSFESWNAFGSKYHTFNEFRKLMTSIQVKDFANAKELINALMDNDYSRIYPTLQLARSRLYGITDAVVSAMGLLKEEIDLDFLRELQPATRVVRCRTYTELQEQVAIIFDALIEYFNRREKGQPPSWFETTLKYIEKHYHDQEINVTAIADYFQINPAYYARIFKKYTGTAPLDYIHKLRMKSAKKLMSKGISVKDAACIVGYGNPLTMSRAFKRYEGITPGAYRKNNSRSGNN